MGSIYMDGANPLQYVVFVTFMSGLIHNGKKGKYNRNEVDEMLKLLWYKTFILFDRLNRLAAHMRNCHINIMHDEMQECAMR